MKHAAKALIPIIAVVLCCAWTAGAENADLYERVEVTLTNDTTFSNPFTDTELRLTVTAPGGRELGSDFTWYGFHDGDGSGGQTGNVWKYRMLFDTPGTWQVQAGFYEPGTSTPNGPSQNYTYNVSSASPSGRHGHIYTDPGNSRRLRHADGTPWIPFAVHSSMLLDRDYNSARTWIDEHKVRGADALAVRFHTETHQALNEPGYWHHLDTNGNRVTSWSGGKWSNNDGNFDFNRFDLASWRHNEDAIEYAHSQDVKLSVWFGVSGLNKQYWSYGPVDHPDNFHLGPQQELFVRYFLARWATYDNWWHWTVDSEYEEGGSGALDRVRTWAEALADQNPWKTILTTHVLSDWTPGVSPEFDMATLQRRVVDSQGGVTDCRSFITDNDGYGIPVFNAEGVWQLSPQYARIATITHIMAGGFSGFAIDSSSSSHWNSSWGCQWNQVVNLHKDGVEELGKLANFFNKTPRIDISLCVPDHSLATVSGGHIAMVLTKAGDSYYVWLDEGGEASLDLTGVAGDFQVWRYLCTDLDTPAFLGMTDGGGWRNLGATPTTGFGADYLFVVLIPDGDLDEDGFVGQIDLDIVLADWGDSVTPGSAPDPFGDGFVGQADLDIVLADWGQSIQPIPEPACMVMLLAGGIGLIRRGKQ